MSEPRTEAGRWRKACEYCGGPLQEVGHFQTERHQRATAPAPAPLDGLREALDFADYELGAALGNTDHPKLRELRRLAAEAAPVPPGLDVERLALPATLDRERAAPSLDVERLRVAAWRLSNAAASLARHVRSAHDPAHRAWFSSASGDVEREVRLARTAAGVEPTAAEYDRLAEKETPWPRAGRT